MASTALGFSKRRISWACPRSPCRGRSSKSITCLFSAPAKPIMPPSRGSPNRRWRLRRAKPRRRSRPLYRLLETEDWEGGMHWLWVIIIGFLAGAIAKLFIAGPGGIIISTLLGIVGAVFARWLGEQIRWVGADPRPVP